MWVLIALTVLSATEIDAYEIGRLDSMQECFNLRDQVLVTVKAFNGVPPINTQYVCVPTEYK